MPIDEVGSYIKFARNPVEAAISSCLYLYGVFYFEGVMAKAWMPFYVADYLADTGHLDHEEHGIYILSLLHYWQTEQPLKANATFLLRVCKCFDKAKFEKLWETVSAFYTLKDGFWYHGRMEKEILKARKVSKQRAKAGSKGGKATATAKDKQLLTQSQSQSQSEYKDINKGFKNPSLEEVKQYCLERKNNVNPQRWFDFYESKGWMIGKNKMKSWKAAVRTWEKSQPESSFTDYSRY